MSVTARLPSAEREAVALTPGDPSGKTVARVDHDRQRRRAEVRRVQAQRVVGRRQPDARRRRSSPSACSTLTICARFASVSTLHWRWKPSSAMPRGQRVAQRPGLLEGDAARGAPRRLIRQAGAPRDARRPTHPARCPMRCLAAGSHPR